MTGIPTIFGFEGNNRFLSNFHPSPVRFEGITYPTAEHAFQAAKTLDKDQRIAVSEEPTPGRAKRAGRALTLREDWDDIRITVMSKVVGRKFIQNHDLMNRLHATGDALLVEATTWHDQFWGVCVCTEHRGKGTNYLGTILMGLRAGL